VLLLTGSFHKSLLSCSLSQIQESTFEQEPGSGAKAIVEGKLVTVGTLEWLQRSVTNASPL
jgi:cation transport ATPase